MATRGFWSRAVVSRSGCWEWTGSTNRAGYGVVTPDGKRVLAHRFAWERARGLAIPDGLVVAHRCDNPACIKPGHLFITTGLGNNRDMIAKGRGSRRGWFGPKDAREAEQRETEEARARVRNLAFLAGILAGLPSEARDLAVAASHAPPPTPVWLVDRQWRTEAWDLEEFLRFRTMCPEDDEPYVEYRESCRQRDAALDRRRSLRTA